MTQLTVDTAAKLVSDFHNSLANHRDTAKTASSDYQVASRKLLYDNLAEAFRKSLLLTSDLKVLGQVCAHYRVNPPTADENPHAAVVRMFWRKPGTTPGSFVPDRSAWKYSKAFRAAQALGWDGDNFSDNVDTFTLEVTKDGKKKTLARLVALETFDTQEHGNPEAVFSEKENRAAQAWLAKNQPSIASFPASLVEAPKSGQMANVVVQYDAQNDVWHVKAVNQSDSDRAWATIAKPTLKAFDDWRKDMAVKMAASEPVSPEGDELFAALASHNSDMDSRNALATWSNRLVGFETDGDFMWPTSSKDVPVTSSDHQEQRDAA